jgi:hypothetical protein
MALRLFRDDEGLRSELRDACRSIVGCELCDSATSYNDSATNHYPKTLRVSITKTNAPRKRRKGGLYTPRDIPAGCGELLPSKKGRREEVEHLARTWSRGWTWGALYVRVERRIDFGAKTFKGGRLWGRLGSNDGMWRWLSN